MLKVRTALHTISLDSKNIGQELDEEGEEVVKAPKAEAYAHLARAVDEYVSDTILVKSRAGHGFPAIAEYLGLETDTVTLMGSTPISGGYQGKNQAKLSEYDRKERNRIIIELWDKGMKQVSISRKMDISACIIGNVISKYLKEKS